jgi:hypothetical protein
MGLFVWIIGSLNFYLRGDGPFVEVTLATGSMSAVIIMILAMIAYGQ